jgi:sugar/nucleoside kinase (ribokinase family)
MQNILLGAVSLDIYTGSGLILPGGGCLNMAYHWQQLGMPFTFITRLGTDHPDVVLGFFERHQIAYLPDSIVGQGISAAIDITILPDGQPHMDNFVEGVWADLAVTAVEQNLVAQSDHVHTVLVEGMIRELERLGEAGALKQPLVTADFLDFRHYTVGRLAETMRWVDVGFIGWPGGRDDERLAKIEQIIQDQQKLLVLTLGAQGVLVFAADKPAEFFPIQPLPVSGTAVGCGDAFIAYFLAEFWRSRNVVEAVQQGAIGGAKALAWQRPLPDTAYG